MGEAPVVVYDGVCALCNRWVAFVLHYDQKGTFRFASFDSDWAAQRGLRAIGQPRSVLLFRDGFALKRSAAILGILRELPGILPWIGSLAVRSIPLALADWAYDRVAQVRYRVFGTTDVCPILPAPIAKRFLR